MTADEAHAAVEAALADLVRVTRGEGRIMTTWAATVAFVAPDQEDDGFELHASEAAPRWQLEGMMRAGIRALWNPDDEDDD
jgi:hypothetical protein